MLPIRAARPHSLAADAAPGLLSAHGRSGLWGLWLSERCHPRRRRVLTRRGGGGRGGGGRRWRGGTRYGAATVGRRWRSSPPPPGREVRLQRDAEAACADSQPLMSPDFGLRGLWPSERCHPRRRRMLTARGGGGRGGGGRRWRGVIIHMDFGCM